jgi:putative Holliday junction resolvase
MPASGKGKPMRPTEQGSVFAAALPPTGSLLALDVSPRRIGLAGTDAGRRLVTPLHTIQRRRLADDLQVVARIAAERETVGLVLGWPLNMDGSIGSACDRIRSFANELLKALPLPILLQDERLTSAAVEDAIAEGLYRVKRRGDPTDHLAAAVILEDALRGLAGRHAPPRSAG